MLVNLVWWILLGLGVGYAVSKGANGRGESLLAGLLIGIVGSLVGGGLFAAMSTGGVSTFNVWSLFVAVIGSVGLLSFWHAFRRQLFHTELRRR